MNDYLNIHKVKHQLYKALNLSLIDRLVVPHKFSGIALKNLSALNKSISSRLHQQISILAFLHLKNTFKIALSLLYSTNGKWHYIW